MRVNAFVPLIALLISVQTYANNIQVSNVTLTGQNIVTHVVQVQFQLTWENSWRINGGPGNWDAAWVFVKYRVGNGPWLHANLNADGTHVAPAGSSISTGLLTPGTAFNITTNPGIGAFIYRSAAGSGTFSVNNAQLQWNYGANGVSDNAVVDVQVFAIEMVYIPGGAFAVGDGLSDGSQYTVTTISTANAITAPSGSGSLGGQAGGYPTGQPAPANASFPNGFNGFYMMKYEVSQQGYVDFLNSLKRDQQANRVTSGVVAVGVTNVTNRYVMSGGSTISSRNGIRCDAVIHPTLPVTFYCDFDGDGIGGESNDGKDIACNFFNGFDILAYLDWTGLRPITELEYEKSGRGPVAPFTGEFAWGVSPITPPTGILSTGTSSESGSGSPNAVFGGFVSGPLRVGCMATSVSTRQDAGAGYYGNMELSGNLTEPCVRVDASTYQGSHGNGLVDDVFGGFTNPDWNTGSLYQRGGFHATSANFLRISDRTNTTPLSSRAFAHGGRGARTF